MSIYDYNEKRVEIRKKIKLILLKHNIEMDVHGCGCCDSPNVSFKYKGDVIADDESYLLISMIDDFDKEE